MTTAPGPGACLEDRTMHRRWIAFPSALAMAAVLAGAVVAGGWAQVTITDPPVDPPVGTGTTIGMQVMQHGVTPVSWPTLTVIATDKISGGSFRTEAKPEGPEGHYVATLVFPSAGAWALTFDSQDLAMDGFVNLEVGPAVAPVAPAAGEAATGQTSSGTATATTPVEPAVFVGIGLLAALAIVLLVVGLRGRPSTTVPG
jgi:hypothetical protein